MKTFAYVRAEVNLSECSEADKQLFMKLQQTNQKPPLTPGCIRFKHTCVVAKDIEEAYAVGPQMLPQLERGFVMNDYVFAM